MASSSWIVLVMVVISLFSQPKSHAQLAGLTYRSVTPQQAQEVRDSWNRWDVVNTAVVLGIVVFCYVAFF